jgi:hypothetical protein
MAINIFTGDLGFEIPADAVKKLQDEEREARDSARRFTEIAEDRARKLDAIRQLAPHLFPPERTAMDVILDSAQKLGAVHGGTSTTLIDAVVKAVTESERPLGPKGIRSAVIAQGDAHLITNENYIYTAIKRATDNGRIRKEGGFYGPPQ